jgi:hypothetical protein
MARPSAPDRVAREGRVQSRAREGDAEAVGADHPTAVRTHEREQPPLALGACLTGLGEARRDHAQRADAVAQAGVGGVEHMLAGNAEDGEVDVVRNLVDRRVPSDAGDRRPVAVDRIRRSAEVGLEDVAEELAADRAATRGRAQDRHRAGREERSERRAHGCVVAAVCLLEERRRRRDRKLDLDLAQVELARHREADLLEDLQHLAVRGHHIGDEALDPRSCGACRQPLEQACADAAALEVVRDRKRDLRPRRAAQSHVVRKRDDSLAALLVGERADQRSAFRPVGIDEGCNERRPDPARAVKAQIAARRREPLEERDERRRVRGDGSAESQRGPVAQDDVVEGVRRWSGRRHLRTITTGQPA